MPDEPVNFDRVTKLYREESQKKALSLLEPDFWEKVNRYLARLEADLAAARGKDPNSKTAVLLQDEWRKVHQKKEQIYAYRERKIALLASQRAGGASVEIRGLAKPEQELLDRLVDLLVQARTLALAPNVLPAAATPTATTAPAAPSPPSPRPEPPAMGVLVHVLEDVPPFAGPDGTYRLRKEDIVVVHPSIAKVLTERGKARIVNAAP